MADVVLSVSRRVSKRHESGRPRSLSHRMREYFNLYASEPEDESCNNAETVTAYDY